MIRIIVPCYNEAERLPIGDFLDFLRSEASVDFDILFVNDGSSDDTIQVLNDISNKSERVSVLDLQKNGGKAEAIRQGMLSSQSDKYSYLAFLDADLATPIEELIRMKDLAFKAEEPYFVMGSRINLLGYSQIKRKASRHYIGRIFATIVSNLLGLAVYDTQCGAKLIRQDLTQELFKERFISKWLFDVEMIFRLKKLKSDYDQRIMEVPLKKWEDKSGSKIKFTYYFQAPIDLLRIYFKYG